MPAKAQLQRTVSHLMTKGEALTHLESRECDACGSAKNPMTSFCALCTYALPHELKSELKNGINYAIAHSNALEWLKARADRTDS
jgi:predicted amidophosphoribosyltransferase